MFVVPLLTTACNGFVKKHWQECNHTAKYTIRITLQICYMFTKKGVLHDDDAKYFWKVQAKTKNMLILVNNIIFNVNLF